MKPCCNHTKQSKKCKRKKDEKVFTLPRKFTKKQCKNQKGFSTKFQILNCARLEEILKP